MRLVEFVMMSSGKGRLLWYSKIIGLPRCPVMDNRRYTKESFEWVLKRDFIIRNFTTRDLEGGKTELHYACDDNELLLARACVTFNDDDINVRDENGQTPLHSTCTYGYVEIARLLLESGAQASLYQKDHEGAMPIDLAVLDEDISQVKLILSYLEDDKELALENLGEAIRRAASYENLEIIKLLVGVCGPALVHSRDYNGNSALHSASAKRDNTEVIEYLVELGADIESVDSDRRSPLFRAACWGCPDAARVLLAAGANVNHMNRFRETALDALQRHIDDDDDDDDDGIREGRNEIYKLLRDAGGRTAAQLPFNVSL